MESSGQGESTDPEQAGLVKDEGSPGRRWFSRDAFSSGSFWTGPFLFGLGLVLAVGLGVLWYVIGGFPHDHDRYGEVAVPGRQVLTLPAEDVRLDFENHATQSGDTTSIDDQPEGLDVRVTPAAGGEQVEVEDVPSWLFSSTVEDRGHEPWGRVDVPSDGDYLVETTADQFAGFKPAPKAAGAAAAPEPPSVDSGAAISVGAAPWNPLGSKLLGAILVGIVVMVAIFAFSLPFRFMRGSSS
jgi:hypothetical protein